jgi:hypothetical protein
MDDERERELEELMTREFPCECWPDNSLNSRWTYDKYSLEIFGVEEQGSSYKADAMLTCSKCGQNWTSMIQFEMIQDEVNEIPSDYDEFETLHLHVFDVEKIRFDEFALNENDGGPVYSFHADCKICFDSVWSGECEWS